MHPHPNTTLYLVVFLPHNHSIITEAESPLQAVKDAHLRLYDKPYNELIQPQLEEIIRRYDTQFLRGSVMSHSYPGSNRGVVYLLADLFTADDWNIYREPTKQLVTYTGYVRTVDALSNSDYETLTDLNQLKELCTHHPPMSVSSTPTIAD
jgi:hypothetical protein